MTNPKGPPPGTLRPGRDGQAHYARILQMLTEQPRTTAQVAVAFGRHSRQSMRQTLCRMRDMGLARITEWVPTPHQRGMRLPVFSAGQGPNAPYPNALHRPALGSGLVASDPRPELMMFAHVIRGLRHGATRRELIAMSGIARRHLTHLLRTMREIGLIHRSGWEERDEKGGSPSEVFSMGRGRDVPKPAPMPRKEIRDRYLARCRARKAGVRVTMALAGLGSIVVAGVQDYAMTERMAA